MESDDIEYSCEKSIISRGADFPSAVDALLESQQLEENSAKGSQVPDPEVSVDSNDKLVEVENQGGHEVVHESDSNAEGNEANKIFQDFDIAKWPTSMKKYVNFWTKAGSKELQNCKKEYFERLSFVQKDSNKLDIAQKICLSVK